MTILKSDDPNGEAGTPNGDEGDVIAPPEITLTPEQIKAEMERLAATNRRLLEESKKHKSKAQILEREKLEAEGKKDELIKQYKEENEALKEKTRLSAIASAIANEASKRGCEDWDHLWMLADQKLVTFDDETENVDGVKEFFDNAQRNPRFQKFFSKREVIRPDVNTPSIATEYDYKKNPLEYLRKIKKDKGHEAYLAAVNRLSNEGLIK